MMRGKVELCEKRMACIHGQSTRGERLPQGCRGRRCDLWIDEVGVLRQCVLTAVNQACW